MTILSVSNLSMDWGGGSFDTTATTERDTTYSPTGIQSITDVPMAGDAWPEPIGDLWFHFRWRTTSYATSINADGYLMSFYSANETLIARLDVSDGDLAVVAYGDSTVTGNYVNLSNNTNLTYDVRISLVGGDITVELYVGGGNSPVSTAVAANTGLKTAPVRTILDVFEIDSHSSKQIFFSEFIVTDGEDTRGWRLATLEPNTNGHYDQWNGDVNELGDTNTATTAQSDTGAERQSWNPTAYGGPASPSSIRAVITKVNAARGVSGSPSQLTQFLRIASTDYDGVAQVFATGEQKALIEVWDNNPNTANPWNTAELATLEVGLLSST